MLNDEEQPLPHAPVDAVSNTLAWVAGLLAAEGFLFLLCSYWASVESWVCAGVPVCCLLLWVGYVCFRRQGKRSKLHLSVPLWGSYISLLLLVQRYLLPMPLPLLGIFFLLGAALLPLMRPVRGAFIIAGLASMAALALECVYLLSTAEAGFSWQLMWGSALSLFALWAQAGAWCRLTTRAGYAGYAFLTPLAGALFLLFWVGGLLLASYLHATGAGAFLSKGAGKLPMVMLLWLVPMALLPLLHWRWARHVGQPVLSIISLAFYAACLLAVPLGCLAAEYTGLLFCCLLLVLYGFCTCAYSLSYRCSLLLPAGALILLSPTWCLLLSGEFSGAVCGGLFILLGMGGLAGAWWLHRRYSARFARMQQALLRRRQSS